MPKLIVESGDTFIVNKPPEKQLYKADTKVNQDIYIAKAKKGIPTVIYVDGFRFVLDQKRISRDEKKATKHIGEIKNPFRKRVK